MSKSTVTSALPGPVTFGPGGHGAPGAGGVSSGYVASVAASLADSATTTKDLASTAHGTTVTGKLTVTDSGTGDTGYTASWSGTVKESDGDTGTFTGSIVKVTGASYALDATTTNSAHGTDHVVINETITGTGTSQVITVVETMTHTALDGTVTTTNEKETFTGGKLTSGTITYADGTTVDLTAAGWHGGHDAGLFLPFC